MKKRGILATALTIATMISGIGIVSAATYKNYDTTVPTFSDYESTSMEKLSTGSASNGVGYIGTGTLVSWIENSSGNNITTKRTYSSVGTYTMDYDNASNYKGSSVHLNISIAPTQFLPVATRGHWTAN